MGIYWNYIRDKRPEVEKDIIIVYRPDPDGRHTIGVQRSWDFGEWDIFIKYCEKTDYVFPDWYWMYAEDFPFPKFPELEEENE